jgi:hypothetical protein
MRRYDELCKRADRLHKQLGKFEFMDIILRRVGDQMNTHGGGGFDPEEIGSRGGGVLYIFRDFARKPLCYDLLNCIIDYLLMWNKTIYSSQNSLDMDLDVVEQNMLNMQDKLQTVAKAYSKVILYARKTIRKMTHDNIFFETLYTFIWVVVKGIYSDDEAESKQVRLEIDRIFRSRTFGGFGARLKKGLKVRTAPPTLLSANLQRARTTPHSSTSSASPSPVAASSSSYSPNFGSSSDSHLLLTLSEISVVHACSTHASPTFLTPPTIARPS